MQQLTKDEAREEILRRWHALPPDDRQSFDQAQIMAAALAAEVHFHTMGNSRKVILGWLVRDLDGLPAWGNIPPESVAMPPQALPAEEPADDMPVEVPSATEASADDDAFPLGSPVAAPAAEHGESEDVRHAAE